MPRQFVVKDGGEDRVYYGFDVAPKVIPIGALLATVIFSDRIDLYLFDNSITSAIELRRYYADFGKPNVIVVISKVTHIIS